MLINVLQPSVICHVPDSVLFSHSPVSFSKKVDLFSARSSDLLTGLSLTVATIGEKMRATTGISSSLAFGTTKAEIPF